MAEYIDKQETIKKVCEGCNIMFDGEPCEPSDCSILKRLWAIPAADVVEVVHGKWVHPDGYVVANGFLCSECGHEVTSHRPINPRLGGAYIADENGNTFYPPEMKYCPKCWAKMDGG